MQAVMVTYQGLMDVRRILRNIGGNLNDVARHANCTGRCRGDRVRCRRWWPARDPVDVAVADLAGLLAAAQRAQLRAPAAPRPAAVIAKISRGWKPVGCCAT